MKKLPSLVGVIHLPPLGGTPAKRGSAPISPAVALQRAGLWAVKEAQQLAKLGFDGIMIENFGDTPFYKDKVPPETIASMAVIAAAVREATRLPVGINILRNDARAALAVAAVTGCDLIRVNVLCGLVATDQGLIEGDAAGLLRERDRLGVDVAILADVHVKHAQTLSSVDIGLAVEEVGLRGMADGIIVTGSTTGRAIDPRELERASHSAREHGIPLYIGSGTTPENVKELKKHVTGLIVGSALRKGGKAGAPLDPVRARKLVAAYKAKRRK